MKGHPVRTSIAVILGLAFAGCAGPAVNHDVMGDTSAAIRGAQEARADDAPQAALHLELANEQLEQARAMAEDDPETANMLLERAHADAELAVALAHSHEMQEEASAAQLRIQELRQQNL